MKTIAQHARGISDLLSQSLAELEAQSLSVGTESVRRAIHNTWLKAIDDFDDGLANLSSAYLAKLHKTLVTESRLNDPSSFEEFGLPILPDGSHESWSRFVKDCRYDESEDALEEEYVLAQLRWGGHVQSFALSVGWIAMNIVRMRRGEYAVYPPRTDYKRLLQFLQDAGPESYDAESGLRGLASEYAQQQIPDGRM